MTTPSYTSTGKHREGGDRGEGGRREERGGGERGGEEGEGGEGRSFDKKIVEGGEGEMQENERGE